MKEKFLQFFTGKMSKSIYISVAAAVVCGAVVITSAVVVHDKNQQVDAVLESLSASESMTESVSESAEESVSASGNEESQQQAQAANNEPAGDKTIQYLAEYDKLTKEYEAQRAELFNRLIVYQEPPYPQKMEWSPQGGDSDEYISENRAKIDSDFNEQVSIWEKDHATWEAEKREAERASKEIEELDAQYEKDVAELKARYGIA